MNPPHILPLISPIGARYESLTVDSKIVNGFAEQGLAQGEFFIYKRPGFTTTWAGTGAAAGNGVFFWNNQFYAVFGGTLKRMSTPPGVVTTIGSVDSSAPYHFSSCLGATPKLFLNNGKAAYTVTATDTLTNVTAAITAQAGFPASGLWVPGAVDVDGYTTIVDATSNIWTSPVNDPATWPGNVGIAQIESDTPIGLAKQISYLLCIKQFYTEAFYDAAQTPWPYGRVDGAKMNYGCIDGRTICDVGGDAMWVGRTRESGAQVVLVSALRPSIVSTPQIERILHAFDYSGLVYSWAAKLDGHRLYAVTSVNSNTTLVYDLTSQLWYQWTDVNGNYVPIASASIGTGNDVVFQHATAGTLWQSDISTYTDNGVVFPVDIYTPNFDGGTRLLKTLTKVSVFGDQANASTVQLRYSDDDYQTWTDAGSTDLSTDDPFWADLASFKKRAFRFTHSANAPFRIQKVELLVSPGSL